MAIVDIDRCNARDVSAALMLVNLLGRYNSEYGDVFGNVAEIRRCIRSHGDDLFRYWLRDSDGVSNGKVWGQHFGLFDVAKAVGGSMRRMVGGRVKTVTFTKGKINLNFILFIYKLLVSN